MIEKILSDVLVFLMSSLKFSYIMIGIIISNARWDVIVSNVLGGIAGIIIFTILGSKIEEIYLKYFPIKKKFSRKTRILAFIKSKFGVWGIALAGPIISFPIAIIVALTITTNKWEIVRKMILSLILWSFVVYLAHFLIRLI